MRVLAETFSIGVRRQDRFELAIYGDPATRIDRGRAKQLGFNPTVDVELSDSPRALDLHLAVDCGRLDVTGDILNPRCSH